MDAFIWQVEEHECYLCGSFITRQTVHYEHVIPLSRGGMHCLDNVRLACAPCNLGKGIRLLSEMAA